MNVVETLPWDEVERRLANGAVAILPVGAGAKEHGLHLPMGTDKVQAEWLAERLAGSVDALIWPTLSYGYYPAFVEYPGSCSLSAETFEAVAVELASSLLAYAPSGVVVLDSGISTIAPIAQAIWRLADPGRVLHLKIHDGPRYREAAARLATQTHGGHADELETARMLVLAPQSVSMERAATGTITPPGPGPLQKRDRGAANYSPSGSIGDPRGATRAMGEALLAAMVEDIIDAVRTWLAG